jgi:hypothetical protein
MNETCLAEIEKTLLVISEARELAERTAKTIRQEQADHHLVEALNEADQELLALHRRLMESAYFGAPSGQLRLASGS